MSPRWLWVSGGILAAACVFSLAVYLSPSEPTIEVPGPVVSPGPVTDPARPPLPALAPTPEVRQELLPPPVAGSWDATPIVGRARALGRIGMELDERLTEMQPVFAECYTKAQQARYADHAPEVMENTTADDPGSPLFVLQLEATVGAVRVVDAPLELHSGASNATIACLQDKLRGARFSVQGEPPARRFRLRYPISP